MILCGHYKGIDQRIRDHYITDEISIGDYVLTGGELAACVIVDSVVRLIMAPYLMRSPPLPTRFKMVSSLLPSTPALPNTMDGKFLTSSSVVTRQILRNGAKSKLSNALAPSDQTFMPNWHP